ncbi:MAG: STAS domain-containing protein [Phycisphaerae bacterium]
MSTTLVKYEHGVVLAVKNDLAGDALDSFNERVERCMSEGHYNIVVDCSAVTGIDSAGLEALADLQDRCEDAFGSVKLSGLDETLVKILEITRLERKFELFQDVDAAVGSFA